ncbi:hybrid sensor histidine kinase/response regulator transcription factor [Sediminitomix flava]|uniref:histidine kinase n=1 Tax=Sediminitomix flava TaxID=379075 RepID=A0A315ZA12_SEDFL|nr:two-component regulator propeller domain-containing protein [Sediminitomix flava]PWJ41903.1 signal transduction histidine kinase [Sediminitomix flava]
MKTNHQFFKGFQYLFLITFLFGQNLLCAQHNDFQHFISFEENIANRPINSFQEDHLGYLWIGSYGGGLYRFDGHNYDAFHFDWQDSTSLSSNFVQAIFEDSQQRLWVGTEKGLNLYQKTARNFQRIELSFQGFPVSVACISEDSDHQILIGTHSFGLVKINPETFEIQRIWKPEGSDKSDPNVYDIVFDKDETAFLATNQGLLKYSKDYEHLYYPSFAMNHSELVHQALESIYLDKEGKLWLGTFENGLYQVKLSQHTGKPLVTLKHFDLTSNRVMDIAETEGDGLWFATENDGLFLFPKGKKEAIQLKKNVLQNASLESNSIWALYTSAHDQLWLGYYDYGIGLFDPNYYKFDKIQHNPIHSNSLKSASVNALVAQGKNVLWIGMDGGGIDKYMINQNRFEHINSQDQTYISGLTNDAVQGLFLDSKENLWVACWDGGIFFLAKGSRNFIHYNHENTNGALASNKVIGFDEDKEGTIWIATFRAGLHSYSYEKNAFTHHQEKEIRRHQIDVSDVRKVLVAHDHKIWIGTTNGLFLMDKNGDDFNIRSFRDAEKFKPHHPNFDYVLTLFEDASHRIWVGTDGAGLYCYDPKSDAFIWYNKSKGLEQDIVCGITASEDGKLWITGKSGVSLLNPETGEVSNFGLNDGLFSKSFNYNAILHSDVQKKVYLGNLKGLNIVKPRAVNQMNSKVVSYLKDLRIYNRITLPQQENSPLSDDISETENITLNHEQNVFTIDFTAIDFTNPDRFKFAYYLEGLENEWNYVSNQRSATYTTLERGDYIFHLKALNGDGEWSEGKTLKIKVLPPWYRSNWAILTYVISLLLVVIGLSYLFQMRFREQEELMREREKFKQEEELHQRKLQFFTNISHEFRTPLTLILNPLNDLVINKQVPTGVFSKFQTIQRNAQRLERLINELMDFRKLNSNKMKLEKSDIQMMDIVSEVSSHFEEESKSRKINLLVPTPQDSPVQVDRGMVEKILFNLLSNAFKLTPDGGQISISIAEQQKEEEGLTKNYLKLSVADTGPGISAKDVTHIFERFYQVEHQNKWYYSGTGIGLEVVKSFMELHEGSVEVESELGKGTVFHLYFPLSFNAEYIQNTLVEVHEVENKHIDFTPIYNFSENIEEDRKATVLIVEDNYELRTYLKTELASIYKIILAKNGAEGVEKAQKHTPDLIITDLMMPEMDGFELCEKVKKNLKTSHIPLLMLTAKTALKDRIRGIDLGADAYLSKPFDIIHLKVQLKQLLHSRQILFEKFLGGFSEKEKLENTTTADKDFLSQVMKLVYEKISDPELSVEVIAEGVYLSRSQLYRKVKALAGVSATEFIRRIRLEEAKKQIQAGNTNISDVGYKVGFSSPSYFSKCYKEYFGILPSDEGKVVSDKKM